MEIDPTALRKRFAVRAARRCFWPSFLYPSKCIVTRLFGVFREPLNLVDGTAQSTLYARTHKWLCQLAHAPYDTVWRCTFRAVWVLAAVQLRVFRVMYLLFLCRMTFASCRLNDWTLSATGSRNKSCPKSCGHERRRDYVRQGGRRGGGGIFGSPAPKYINIGGYE